MLLFSSKIQTAIIFSWQCFYGLQKECLHLGLNMLFLKIQQGEPSVAKVKCWVRRLITLHTPLPPLSSPSTSSLSFFHGPINLSQGCISNWLQTICSGFCDERRCQNLLVIYYCHCRPPGRRGWCLFQLIRALWDTWRNAKG